MLGDSLIAMSTLNIGDLIDTPYGQGVVISPGVFIQDQFGNEFCRVKVTVSGTDYQLKCVGVKPYGHIELPG